MPSVLKNAPQIFHRRIHNILKDLNYCCLVYTHHILVFSNFMEQQEDEVLSITKGFIDYDDQKKLSFKFVNLKCNVDR